MGVGLPVGIDVICSTSFSVHKDDSRVIEGQDVLVAEMVRIQKSKNTKMVKILQWCYEIPTHQNFEWSKRDWFANTVGI